MIPVGKPNLDDEIPERVVIIRVLGAISIGVFAQRIGLIILRTPSENLLIIRKPIPVGIF